MIFAKPLKVIIVSRIFEPEPSAASFRLGALATSLSDHNHHVKLLTVKPPSKLKNQCNDHHRPYKVSRFPVFRDSSGYVRGYLQYMSFDIPLFFRVLFGRKVNAIVVEPPPTSGFIVRLAASLRRIPYFYYAADIWSDGAAQTNAPDWVLKVIFLIEKFTLKGAKKVFSVSNSLTERLQELKINANVVTVGNGVNAKSFLDVTTNSIPIKPKNSHTFIYAGIASEWHGAGVFIEALPHVHKVNPEAIIRFVGGGSDVKAYKVRAAELGVANSVTFEDYVAPAELAHIFAGSVAALASIRPGQGNEYVFPTKLYSSVLCGVPAIFAGIGPAVDFLATKVDGVPLGVSVALDPIEVASAMLNLLDYDEKPGHRELVSEWGIHNVTLASVAEQVVNEIENGLAS